MWLFTLFKTTTFLQILNLRSSASTSNSQEKVVFWASNKAEFELLSNQM